MGSRSERGERPVELLHAAVGAAAGGGVHVGVVHPSGPYRRGVAVALRAAGLAVDEPPDPVVWVDEGDGERVVVCAVRSEEDRELMGKLAARVRVVALVPAGEESEFGAAFRAGACGVVGMDRSPEWIAAVVVAALAGFVVIPREVATRFAAAEGLSAALTSEERLLLRRLGEGATNTMLAGELGVNERTVRRRLAALYEKLGATSRAECLVVAGRLGQV